MDWSYLGGVFAAIVIFYYIDKLRGEVSEIKTRLAILESRNQKTQ